MFFCEALYVAAMPELDVTLQQKIGVRSIKRPSVSPGMRRHAVVPMTAATVVHLEAALDETIEST